MFAPFGYVSEHFLHNGKRSRSSNLTGITGTSSCGGGNKNTFKIPLTGICSLLVQ
uniref:Candidate secreted effector n=1 Tax=Meloidogyne incognita TaxID=6306 RepID=A0A914NQ62_MELIC